MEEIHIEIDKKIQKTILNQIKSNPNFGLIYILVTDRRDVFKIGETSHWDSRKVNYQTGNCNQRKVCKFFVVDNRIQIEKHIKRMLQKWWYFSEHDQRHKNEMIQLPLKDIIQKIEDILIIHLRHTNLLNYNVYKLKNHVCCLYSSSSIYSKDNEDYCFNPDDPSDFIPEYTPEPQNFEPYSEPFWVPSPLPPYHFETHDSSEFIQVINSKPKKSIRKKNDTIINLNVNNHKDRKKKKHKKKEHIEDLKIPESKLKRIKKYEKKSEAMKLNKEERRELFTPPDQNISYILKRHALIVDVSCNAGRKSHQCSIEENGYEYALAEVRKKKKEFIKYLRKLNPKLLPDSRHAYVCVDRTRNSYYIGSKVLLKEESVKKYEFFVSKYKNETKSAYQVAVLKRNQLIRKYLPEQIHHIENDN